MTDYYKTKLAADRLRGVYEVAPPRVRQYLEAEIVHVMSRLHSSDTVLELGCGYGRVLKRLAKKVGNVVGIDNSLASLLAADDSINNSDNIELVCMDAVALGFADDSFDCIICIQNGISAFHVNPYELLKETVRVTKPGGRLLFSSYASDFWDDRLEWFRIQSEAGQLGEIDWDATGNGVIICKDGFHATTYNRDDFRRLMVGFDESYTLDVVDGSSLFCEIRLTER
ncbi:MAG: class I SAM-dependent methyltransferase [candidate division Zixibacteria bacterium]|nr:class I SAM-dependent methyltransferase [candidate division Zixibacteria bacterium]